MTRGSLLRSVLKSVDPQITTGYNLEDDRCECVALKDYKEGEQVGAQNFLDVVLNSM